MSLSFVNNDGSLQSIRFRIVNATATVIVDTTDAVKGGAIQVSHFQVNQNDNSGTPTLTVDIFNPTDSSIVYLGTGGVVYHVKTLTAGQSILFSDGYVIPNGCQLRVTSGSSSGLLDVVGIKIGRSASPVR